MKFSADFKTFVYVGVGLIVMASSASSQLFTSKDIFAVTPADYRYLWYGEIANHFDSAMVRYKVGEFSTASGTDTTRILLRLNETQWKNEQCSQYAVGMSAEGRDTILQEFIRTSPFTIADSSTSIQFFRMASVEDKTDCATVSEFGENDPPGTWREVQLSLPNSTWISDDTRIVIELVNVTKSSVITIDSVRVSTGAANSMRVFTGGDNVKAVQLSRLLPDSIVGDEVYLRVVPYRYGPTPVGVAATLIKSEFSLSTVYSDTSVSLSDTPRWLSAAFTDTIYQEYASRIISYLVSDTTRSCLPVVFGFNSLPTSISSDFYNTISALGIYNGSYCSCSETWFTDSLEIYSTLYPVVTFNKRSNRSSRGQNSTGVLMVLSSSTINHSSEIELTGESSNVTVQFFDLQGRLVETVWTGSSPATIQLSSSTLPNGVGILIMTVADKMRTQATKVLVDL